MKKKFQIYLNAPITLGFVALCIIATLLGEVSNGKATYYLFSTYRSSLLNPLTYLRLFSYIFGHANFAHLFSNLIYILLLGPILEEKYQTKLIGIIALVAFSTAIIHNIFFADRLLGASGVVFAFILLASITGERGGIPITLILVAIIYLGEEVLTALTVQDDISQMAHILGGICGALLGLSLKNKHGFC